jgi:hypothetical protein
MEVIGVIKRISDLQKISDKFTKQEFVVTIDGSTPYPQHIQLQCTQDKCNLLAPLNEGDEVKVYYNLRGKEYTDKEGNIKFFNTIECWRIEKV